MVKKDEWMIDSSLRFVTKKLQKSSITKLGSYYMGEIEDSCWCELFRRKFILDFYCSYSINCPVELKPCNDQHYPTRLLTTYRVPPWGWVKIFRKKADFRAQMVLTRQRKEILWYQCLKRVRWGWKYSPWPNKHQIWAFSIVIVMILWWVQGHKRSPRIEQ